jgi:hypothetical protein
VSYEGGFSHVGRANLAEQSMRIDVNVFLANEPDLARDDISFIDGPEDRFDTRSNGSKWIPMVSSCPVMFSFP